MLSLPIPWPLLLALARSPLPSFYYVPLPSRDHRVTDYLFRHSWTVLALSLSILSLVPSLLWLTLTGRVLFAASQRNNTSARSTRGPSDKTAMKQQDVFIPIPDNTGLVENCESLYPSDRWCEPFSYVKTSPFLYSPSHSRSLFLARSPSPFSLSLALSPSLAPLSSACCQGIIGSPLFISAFPLTLSAPPLSFSLPSLPSSALAPSPSPPPSRSSPPRSLSLTPTRSRSRPSALAHAHLLSLTSTRSRSRPPALDLCLPPSCPSPSLPFVHQHPPTLAHTPAPASSEVPELLNSRFHFCN